MNSVVLRRMGTTLLLGTGLLIVVTAGVLFGAAEEPELVENGDFATSTVTKWTLKVQDSTNVTGAISMEEYVITRAAEAAADDTNSWNIQFSHSDIEVIFERSYTVSFRVKADTTFIMQVNVGMNKDPWETYSGYQQVVVDTAWDTVAFEFIMADSTDTAARLVFDMGLMNVAGTITLDDISIKAIPQNTTSDELVRNGDFSSTSLAAWTVNLAGGALATRSIADGQLVVDITQFCTPDSAAERYYVQLQQTGIKLEQSREYEIKFHAKSDSIYQIMVYLGMNKDPWGNYSGWSFTPIVTPDWDSSYSDVFVMDSVDDIDARLVFDLGDVSDDGPRKVYFDNISVMAISENVGAPDRIASASQGLIAGLRGRNLEIYGVAAPVSAELFNAAGKVIASFRLAVPKNGTAIFELDQALGKGVYITRITETPKRSKSLTHAIRFVYQ